MSRQYADQLSTPMWMKGSGSTFYMEFRLTKLEVYWDASEEPQGFRFEVQGAVKFRSKKIYATLDLAKYQALRKLNDLINIEVVQVDAALTDAIPF